MIGNKQEKVWQAGPLGLFWAIWKARNGVPFKDELLSIQRLKTSFVFRLQSETKLSILDSSSTVSGFIDWMGSK